MEEYYTAKEAAEKLGLRYHTFLARVHRGLYTNHRIGWMLLFNKKEIDGHATNRHLAKSTR